MVKTKKWILASQFEGAPKESNFRLEEEELPALKDGDVLFEAVFLSVDPYMRAFRSETGSTFYGEQIARVVESKNKDYPVGCLVQMHSGWRLRTVLNPKNATAELRFQKVPDFIKKEQLSLALGVLGMPGVTAYTAFLNICKPKAGETVLVNGAAGAVGSVVGQIAKIKGCKVIGFAGSKAKCDWVMSLGFDRCFNYKEEDVDTALKQAAPDGVDCFYDNVGGEFSSKAINHMNSFGRIAVGGAISTYNADQQPKLPFPFTTILVKQLKIEGFVVYSWMSRYPEAKAQMHKWINEGKIKHEETVINGFDKMPKAFISLLTGGNTGKMVVKA